MKERRFGKAAMEAHIISAIFAEYKGNPRALARDSGACQRAASYWLEGKHILRLKYLLNLMVNNEAIEKAIMGDLIGKVRAIEGLPLRHMDY